MNQNTARRRPLINPVEEPGSGAGDILRVTELLRVRLLSRSAVPTDIAQKLHPRLGLGVRITMKARNCCHAFMQIRD